MRLVDAKTDQNREPSPRGRRGVGRLSTQIMLRQAVQALFAGLLLCVCISWGTINFQLRPGWFPTLLRSGYTHRPVAYNVDGRWWVLVRSGSIFEEVCTWISADSREAAMARATQMAVEFEGGSGKSATTIYSGEHPSMPAWWSHLSRRASTTGSDVWVYEIANGFPARCFIRTHVFVQIPGSSGAVKGLGGWIEFAGWFLLYLPLGFGLALDSVFYGAFAGVFFGILRHRKRELRRRRGLCPWCGYPRTGLAAEQCPECGRAV